MSESSHPLRLKSLHTEYDIQDVDIRPFVEQVRTEGVNSLHPMLDAKIRRNVLTVLLTEDYWDYVENMEAASPHTFGLPEEDVTSIENLASNENLPMTIKGIREITEKHLLLCAEFCDYFPDPIVEELKQLRFTNPFGKEYCPYPERFAAGIQNANMMGWESIHQLPYLFKKQFPEENFTTQKYQEMAARNVAYLRNLAGTNMLMFGAAHNVGQFTGFPAFTPMHLTLTGSSESLHMELSDSLQAHIELYREEIQHTLATGCPALIAKSVDGKDVMSAMYEWIRKVADRFFFPHAQEILARSDISELWGIAKNLREAVEYVQARLQNDLS